MKTVSNKIISIIITLLVCISVVSVSAFAADSGESKYVGDEMVYLTQRWLNQEYGDVEDFGSVTENGKTGWDTVYGLLRALQHELGITELANSFGSATVSAYEQNILKRQDGVKDKKYAILQCALWCKGYNPGYKITEKDGKVIIDAVFDYEVEYAVKLMKTDAGFTEPDGVVTVNVMKALLSMDSFKLLGNYGETEKIRKIQQELNRKYEAYTGLNPCDGIYGRNTNKALIYALQAEEKLPIGTANGNFGATTKLCCPEIPYDENGAKSYPGTAEGSAYTQPQITEFTKILQYALTVNGFDTGEADGVYDDELRDKIKEFQTAYGLSATGKADKGTWMSLLTSSGDTSRPAVAADCATILTAEKAKTLYSNGYRYIGRYLTGTYNGGVSKAITKEEAEIIFDAGLRFFPIYQTSARLESYFTESQGTEDAKAAIEAAQKLGIPKDTIIYFAVDFDATASHISSRILPYFEKVSEVMNKSVYRTGVYGTRNVCISTAEKGYTCSSFVSDMSTGFSGNLGFRLPSDWAFDQFATVTLGSGDGEIEIDKNGFSGRDKGVAALHVHSYSNACDKECNTCGESRTVPAHKYSNSCDTTCNECSAKRTIKHTYSNACDKSCNVCEATRTPAAHKWTAATCTKAKTCSVCKTTSGKALGHTYKNVTAKATLSENGKTERKCSVCSYISKTTTVYYPKTFKLSAASYTYNKKTKTPTVTVKDSKGNTLKKDTDYTVSYEKGRKLPGKYTVKITFKGKYSGVKRLYFTIKPRVTSKITASQTTTTITLKWTAVTGADGYRVYKYNTKKKKYEKLKDVTKTTLKISDLKAGTVYKYKVRAYTKDDGTIWGSYSDVFETATKCKTPKITKLTTTKGKASLAWSNVSGESGYQVYYSTKKDSGYKKVKSYKANVVKGSKSKLKSGKKYYFKVRAYKKTDSGTVYSSWSKVKSIKIK